MSNKQKNEKMETSIFTFQETQQVIWFCQWMPLGKDWMIWCERNGERVRGTLEFKKRLNKEFKDIFCINK
jgi:hypothetical protein